jgi:type II secretory pathway pseudopilin PulG
MIRDNHAAIYSERGISMLEMLTVFLIIGILAAVAIPNFMQFRQRLEYRETARSIASVIRQAQSQSRNGFEQQVEFNAARQYGFKACEQANNALCAGPLTNVNTLPTSVFTIPPAANSPIRFWANGRVELPNNAFSISIPVNDSTNMTRFQVNVFSTGQVRITP